MLRTNGQVVDIAADIDIATIKPTLRVALRSDSYTLHKILPNKVDPLVSLMMVEKVPDSTYESVRNIWGRKREPTVLVSTSKWC